MEFANKKNNSELDNSYTLIQKLYDIIINSNNGDQTFINYKKLFKEFYDNESLYLRYITDDRVKTIVSFFIKHEKEQISEYAQRDIIKAINDRVMIYLTNYRFKDVQLNDKDIKTIFDLKDFIIDFNSTINSKDYLNSLQNDYNKKGISELKINDIIREFEAAIILTLNSNILNFSVDNIKKMSNAIQSSPYNGYIVKLLNEKKDISMLDRDYIFEYINKFISINEIVDEKSICDDKLIFLILKYSSNYELFEYLFNNMDVEEFINQFDNDVSKVEERLNDFDNPKVEDFLFNLLNKMFNKELMIELYDYYEKSPNNPFFSKTVIELMDNYIYTSEIEKLDNSIIMKLLEKESSAKNILISNIMEYQRINQDLDESIISKINENEKVVNKILEIQQLNFSQTIDLLNNAITMGNSDNFKTMLLLKNFAKLINKDELKIYFGLSDNYLGYYENEKNILFLDIKNTLKLCNFNKTGNIEDLDILKTIFHESIHHSQFSSLTGETKQLFLSDKIIEKYFPKFYEKNYRNISYEVDARISSYHLMKQFFEKFSFSDKVNDFYDKLEIEDMAEVNKSREIDGTNKEMSIMEIFEFLLKIKPNIKEKEEIKRIKINDNDYKEFTI